jgi:YHS domain-containing protein
VDSSLRPVERQSRLFLCDIVRHEQSQTAMQQRTRVEMAIVRDVVCGRAVDSDAIRTTPTTRWRYEGQTYYFCSKHCRDEFLTVPEKYLGDQGWLSGT